MNQFTLNDHNLGFFNPHPILSQRELEGIEINDRSKYTNTGYINAYSVCELLIKLSQKYGSLPISIFLDNARYQKCRLVQATAELFDIELLYLPTYSPNLNLIERMWKFVKKKCLNSKYYPDFDSFKKSITEVLAKTNGCYKKELDSLLSLKFQSFKNSKIMAR